MKNAMQCGKPWLGSLKSLALLLFKLFLWLKETATRRVLVARLAQVGSKVHPARAPPRQAASWV